MTDALSCDRCGRVLENDDAVSIIEGVCTSCRRIHRGLIQPLRADQIVAGITEVEEIDEFPKPVKPRFTTPLIQSPAPVPAVVPVSRAAPQPPPKPQTTPAFVAGSATSVSLSPPFSETRSPTIEHREERASHTEIAAPLSRKSDASVPTDSSGHEVQPFIRPPTSTQPELLTERIRNAGTESIMGETSHDRANSELRGLDVTQPKRERLSEPPAPAVRADRPSRIDSSVGATPAMVPPQTRNVIETPSVAPAMKKKVESSSKSEGMNAEDRRTAEALVKMAASSQAPSNPGGKPTSPQSEAEILAESLESARVRRRANNQRFRPPPPPFNAEPMPRLRRRRRDLLIGSVAGLLLTSAVAYYALRSHPFDVVMPLVQGATAPVTLTLRVSPPFADVKLDGRTPGEADSLGRIRFEIPADEIENHQLEISAEGYHSLRQPVSTYLGAPEAMISLVREPYELTVTTSPPASQVWIDGELRGNSPLTLTLDPTTEPEIAVRSAGFVERIERIKPPENDSKLAMNFDLVTAGQLITVHTDPPGATIRVDGKLKGVSPLRIELEPFYLGRNVEIAAMIDGYDNARMHVRLPEQGGGDALSASLALKRTLARINVYTDPPGGRVMIAGKDYGASPVQIEFDPEQTGKSVVVEASMGGTHIGRQEVTVPAAGEPALLMMQMSFGAQRVVFAVAAPPALGADFFALVDQMTSQIQSLQTSQRFAVIAATDDGFETWPGGLSMEAATSEQKVRAYDRIRSIRPITSPSTDALLRATLAFQPTTVWLFMDGKLDRRVLDRFSEALGTQPVSVNLIRATPAEDERWLDAWAAAHRGTYRVIGRDSIPALAVDANADAD